MSDVPRLIPLVLRRGIGGVVDLAGGHLLNQPLGCCVLENCVGERVHQVLEFISGVSFGNRVVKKLAEGAFGCVVRDVLLGGHLFRRHLMLFGGGGFFF